VGSTGNLFEIFRSSGSHQPVQTFGQMCSHLGWPLHHDDIAPFDIFTVEIVKLEVVLKLPDHNVRLPQSCCGVQGSNRPYRRVIVYPNAWRAKHESATLPADHHTPDQYPFSLIDATK
jgi:hypothetical protein